MHPATTPSTCPASRSVLRIHLRRAAAILLVWGTTAHADPLTASAVDAFRQPSESVTRLLTAAQSPEPLLHARSGQVALLHRETVIELERLIRPRLGLAGFRYDRLTGTSGVAPLITRIEVVSAKAPEGTPSVWTPAAGTLLDHVRFSPDGMKLAAVLISDGPARLAIFDIASGQAKELATPIQAAWGPPCHWIRADALLCRLVPANLGPAPVEAPVPMILEHQGGPAPIRTYPNLLKNSSDDALFEYFFAAEVARVGVDSQVQLVPGLSGLLANVDPSPDGAYAVVTRIEPPYPRLVGARRFPSRVEVWDLDTAKRLYSSGRVGFGAEDTVADANPRRAIWKAESPTTLGFIDERGSDGSYRWMAVHAPFAAKPREVVRSAAPIDSFGWTTAGTPWFSTPGAAPTEMRVNVVLNGTAQQIWSGSVAERYDTPGRAIREDGSHGPVLESDGRIFLAGDGLSPDGPQPFLDAFDLRTRKSERLFSAAPGVFEPVLGLLDTQGPTLVTSRETATEPPHLFVVRGDERLPLGPNNEPFADLADTTREVVRYTRADGVALSGTLYLPAKRSPGERLPTLLWIYPYEFSDREHAEQIDVRSFRYHRVKGPSPLAALVEGYALLLNPTVPIVSEDGEMKDDYLEQLVSSAEAAVDYLVARGVTDPARVAVGGRSYGAFSSANLLIHSEKFATAIAMSGAYNRTLTPFGFQHEYRSFWEATQLYTKISPFYFAHQVERPLLLVHGGADENGGTPPMQARRFFHALMGQGARVRYVELPGEGHHYWARENVLLAAAELIDWLDLTIGHNARTVRNGTRAE